MCFVCILILPILSAELLYTPCNILKAPEIIEANNMYG